jgi:hypothetical protein
MRIRMLRSVLAVAFSAVVAMGALSGLSGTKSDEHEAGGVHFLAVTGPKGEPAAVPADSTWD